MTLIDTSTSMSEKTPLIPDPTSTTTPSPTFTIRRTTKADVAGIVALDAHNVAHNMTSLRAAPPKEASLLTAISDVEFPHYHHYVAVAVPSAAPAPTPAPAPASPPPPSPPIHTLSSLLHLPKKPTPTATTTASATASDPPSAPTETVLGWCMLTPYSAQYVVGPHIEGAYKRTASIYVAAGADDRGGAIESALLATVLAQAKRHDVYRQVLASMQWREADARLAVVRQVFRAAGFREVGRFEEVVEKEGVLLDVLKLQRAL